MNRAQRALDSIHGSPHDALALARAVLDDPTTGTAEKALAAWALGRAYIELDRIEPARSSLEEGLGLAADGGLTALGADIGVSLSLCRLTAGDTDAARALLAEAEPHLDGQGSKGRFFSQRGLTELHLGDLEAAVANFDKAERLLAPGVDDHARARLLVNRGVVLVMNGDLDPGEADCLEARNLADGLGQRMLSAGAAQNLGYVAGRRGDVPKALSWFDESRATYEELGSPRRAMVALESDVGSVLLSGGLYAEAARAAERAASMAAAGGNRLTEAEALLLLARIRLADGSYPEAEEHALAARDLFGRSAREAWVAMADYIGLQAAAKQEAADEATLLARATEITDELHRSGWRRDSLEVRTFAGRTALALGRLEEARAHLSTAAEARHTGSSSLRAAAWLAAASLDLADGRRPEARRALSTGMEIVEDHRSSLGSTELRAHASINGAELAELGLTLAHEDDDRADVFRWAERTHAGGVQLAPVRPAADSRLAAAMVELRQAHAAAIQETADPLTDPDDAIAVLEREVSDLSRRAAGGAPTRSDRAGLDAIRRHLGDDTLVEYFTLGRDLHAIVVTVDRLAIHDLGPLAPVEGDVTRLVSTLERLAFGSTNVRMADATAAALEATSATLDDRLIAPLDLRPSGELVVVPTGPLQGLAWATLPSLRSRPVTITPSGGLWAAPTGDGRATAERPADGRGGRALLVGGTSLAGAAAEIARLDALYDETIVLSSTEATVAAVLAAMEEVDLVHVAAHGTFRADNPMFSALELHDGPLTVYDLETLSKAPEVVVLPACDAGRSSVRHGDELLGTASALLQVGVRTVVAPVTLVPDTDVVPALMVELHRLLRAGTEPSAALVTARRSIEAEPAGNPERSAWTANEGLTMRSFVSIGARRN